MTIKIKTKKQKTKKTKVKIPKIYKSKNGRRYIIVKKKKVYLADDLSERELIKYIISMLAPKRRKRNSPKSKDKDYKNDIKSTSTSGFQIDQLMKAKQDIADIKSKTEKDKLSNDVAKSSQVPMLKGSTIKMIEGDKGGNIKEVKYQPFKLPNGKTVYVENADDIRMYENKMIKLKRNVKKFKKKAVGQEEKIQHLDRKSLKARFNILKLSEPTDKQLWIETYKKKLKSAYNVVFPKKLNGVLRRMAKQVGIDPNLGLDDDVLVEELDKLGAFDNKLSKADKDEIQRYYNKYATTKKGKEDVAKQLGINLDASESEEPSADDDILQQEAAEARAAADDSDALPDLELVTDDDEEDSDDNDKGKSHLKLVPMAIKPFPANVDFEYNVSEGGESGAEASAESSSDQDGDGSRKNDDKGLSTTQINQIMKPYGKEYLGCIGSDQIASVILPQVKPHSRICWVMNTDTSDKPGSHWVAVLIDGRPNGSHSVEYYNPLGNRGEDKAPKKFIKDIKPVLKKLANKNYYVFKQNLIPDQNNKTSNCGYFATNFLIKRMRGKSWTDASGWDDKAEAKIEKMKKTFPPFKYISGFDSKK